MPATTHALTDGQALPVSSFSFINIRFNADANPVTIEGSLSDSEFSVIHDRITVGGPVFEDSDGRTSFNQGRIITLDVRAIEEIRFVGTAVNINVSPFDQSLIVAAATEGDVRAAIEQARAAGGGNVAVMRGLVTLTAPLPIYDGVYVRGTTLGALDFTTIPDSTWNFDENDITLFKGDGTFNAFQHNHVGTGTLPTDQAAFANEMATNWGIQYCGFDNFTSAVHVGAQNKGGGFFFNLRDLLIKNTKVWGLRVTNSMHYLIERIKVVNSFAGGAALFEGDCPDTILQTGNCFIRHFFACPNGDASGNTPKQRRLAKGVEFRASHSGGGTGILNEVHVDGLQVNMFNRTGLSVTATFTSGSANVQVPDGTEFAVGMPLRFTTTPASGFATNTIYVVRSVIGNNLQLALDRSSTVITAGSSTTATLVCNGQPAMSVYGDTANSRVNNSRFMGLDLEGHFAAGLYSDRAGTSRFSFQQVGLDANNVDIVARSCANCEYVSLNTAVTDFDSASASSSFAGRQTRLNRPGKGFFFETGLNGHCFSVGGSFISAIRMTGGDGFRMATDAGFGLQPVQRTSSLTMTNNHFGAIVLSGTTAGQNITLPVASSSTGETGNAGALAVIINRSNQNWTIQTQSSQTFNGVAGKTSFTLPAGQMAWCVSDGTGYGGGLFGLLP